MFCPDVESAATGERLRQLSGVTAGVQATGMLS